ncbi:GatB/YqeY domain-containing protein [Candidatus Wolfebacteria bacterium]|nr:GatB/YqeY domain-containing protein [Candidatus Wolfebacteria bacterium]
MVKEKLTDDLKAAMKEGRVFELGVLRMISAALHNKEIEKKGKGGDGELSDDDVLAVFRTEAKKRKDAAALYSQGGRGDLKEKEEKEIAVIERYLPRQASSEEVEKAVNDAIASIGASSMKDMGRVIAEAIINLGGRGDGSVVSAVAKQKLGA